MFAWVIFLLVLFVPLFSLILLPWTIIIIIEALSVRKSFLFFLSEILVFKQKKVNSSSASLWSVFVYFFFFPISNVCFVCYIFHSVWLFQHSILQFHESFSILYSQFLTFYNFQTLSLFIVFFFSLHLPQSSNFTSLLTSLFFIFFISQQRPRK